MGGTRVLLRSQLLTQYNHYYKDLHYCPVYALDNIEEYHRPWALELKKKFDYLKSSTDLNDFVNKELSNKFVSVLEHCGVFKLNEEGLEGFKRFTNSLNS